MGHDQKVEFYRHNLGDDEKQAIVDAMDSLVLTTGKSTKEMEAALAEYLGVKHVVGVDSCTAGLHLSLLAMDIGPGDEVIVPAMTFIATANAVIMAGGTPVFADVDSKTGNITAATIESKITPATRAIIPVHLYGLLCDMDEIDELARRHRLEIIEDSAHCLEAEFKGVRPGSHSRAACFSFYATKALTCGEGGAIATNDDAFADRCRQLALHGMSTSAYDRYAKAYQHWDMAELGWKYNLDNLRASLITPQIAKLDKHRARRGEICKAYEKAFDKTTGIDFPRVHDEAATARHLFTIWVEPSIRDDVLAEIQSSGVGIAVNYRAVHLMHFYRKRFGYRDGDFPAAELIGERTISLPLYPSLTDDEVDLVIKRVKAAVAGVMAGCC